MRRVYSSLSLFFFNDTATTEIYTLSLHDALPISRDQVVDLVLRRLQLVRRLPLHDLGGSDERRPLPGKHEEHALVSDRLQQQSRFGHAMLQQEMAAAHERENVAGPDVVLGQQLVHPWPRGIDDEVE